MKQNSNIKQPSCIITGITRAKIGSLLSKYLLEEKNYKVIGARRRISLFNSGRLEELKIFNHPNLKLEYFDSSDPVSINKLINQYKPDECYNLAALSHVKVSFDLPIESINSILNGTVYFLEAIKTLSPKTKYYGASSSEQYGNVQPEFISGFHEEEKFNPASPYAVAKCAAHEMVKVYRQSYGLFACSGILFNHSGSLRGETFVCRKITKAATRIKIGLQNKIELGNIKSFRDWGSAKEYVKYMHLMLQQKDPEEYIIATGHSISVEEFLKKSFDSLNLDYKKYFQYNAGFERPNEVLFLKGDSTKAKNHLDFKLETTVDNLIEEMISADLKKAKQEKENLK